MGASTRAHVFSVKTDMPNTGYKYDIELVRGDSFSVDFQLQDQNGTPINISGYSFSGAIRSSYCGTVQSYLSFTPIAPSGSGIFTMALGSAASSNLSGSKFIYDAKGYVGNDTITLVHGDVNVYPSVT